MELSIPWFWVKGRKAHMGLFHFWARGPPRPPASLYTRLPEKRRPKPSGRWSWWFRPLFVVFLVSERVSVSAKRYHANATRCKPTTA